MRLIIILALFLSACASKHPQWDQVYHVEDKPLNEDIKITFSHKGDTCYVMTKPGADIAKIVSMMDPDWLAFKIDRVGKQVKYSFKWDSTKVK